jgi:hypothetical protein
VERAEHCVERSVQCGEGMPLSRVRRLNAIEEGWFLRELETRFGLTRELRPDGEPASAPSFRIRETKP